MMRDEGSFLCMMRGSLRSRPRRLGLATDGRPHVFRVAPWTSGTKGARKEGNKAAGKEARKQGGPDVADFVSRPPGVRCLQNKRPSCLEDARTVVRPPRYLFRAIQVSAAPPRPPGHNVEGE